MASVKQFQVTFDCAEPERVARFWCEVLGYVVPPPPQGFATWDEFDRALPAEQQGSALACVDPTGWARDCSSSAFPREKSSRTGSISTCGSAPGWWAKSAWPRSRPSAHGWSRSAPSACASCLPMSDNESCLVMQDVEGNEFCLGLIPYGGSAVKRFVG